MVGFIRKKVKSQTLGERLREIRERRGISLDEISRSTRIRKHYLVLLEKGDHESLPPEVYVRGFLSGYCGYLGIEVQDALEAYEKERGMKKNIKEYLSPEKIGGKFSFPSIVVTPKMFGTAIFVLMLVFGAAYFYSEVGKFSQEPRLTIYNPASNVSLEGSSIEVSGMTDRDCSVTINGQPVFINEKGEFGEKINLGQGVNDLEIVAENRFGNSSQKKISVFADYQKELAKEVREEDGNVVMGANDDQSEKLLSLEISVVDFPTWIAVDVDGKQAHKGTMLAGAKLVFEGEENISVTSGRANNTKVVFNGKDLGLLGDSSGVIRDIVFTKETEFIPKAVISESGQRDESEEN